MFNLLLLQSTQHYLIVSLFYNLAISLDKWWLFSNIHIVFSKAIVLYFLQYPAIIRIPDLWQLVNHHSLVRHSNKYSTKTKQKKLSRKITLILQTHVNKSQSLCKCSCLIKTSYTWRHSFWTLAILLAHGFA